MHISVHTGTTLPVVCLLVHPILLIFPLKLDKWIYMSFCYSLLKKEGQVISACLCNFIIQLYLQSRSYYHLCEMFGVCSIITYTAVIVTGFSFQSLTLGITHFWLSTDLSQMFTYMSPYRGTILLILIFHDRNFTIG